MASNSQISNHKNKRQYYSVIYNSNPMSLEKAIRHKHENKVMILGDMFELGEEQISNIKT